MTINKKTPTASLRWSQVASTLELPESIKSSVALPVHLSDANIDLNRSSVISLNEAWKKTSDYALDKMLNRNRDSDRLARATIRRAHLPIPSLELLADFPYGKVSSPQVEKRLVDTLRISSKKTLENMAKLSSPAAQTTEDKLPRLHDLHTIRETYKTICALSEIDFSSVRPLILSLSDKSSSNFLPSAHQDKSSERELMWSKIAAKKGEVISQ